jgi:hypothetical protein
MKQKLLSALLGLGFLVIAAGGGQIGLFFWTGKSRVPKNADIVLTEKLKAANANNAAARRPDEARKDLYLTTVEVVSTEAAMFLKDQSTIRINLLSLGSGRNIDEDIVDRYELHYRFRLQTKILAIVDFEHDFEHVVNVGVTEGGFLRYYVVTK